MMLMKELLKIKNIYYIKSHISTKSGQVQNDEATVARIKELNKYDVMLYKFAKERFEEKLSDINELDKKLHKFQEDLQSYKIKISALSSKVKSKIILELKGIK